MEAQGPADNARVTAQDLLSRQNSGDSAKEQPAQLMLGFVLLLIGAVAFSPMFLPMLTGHQHQATEAPRPTFLNRSGKSRDMLYMQAHEMANRGQYEPAIEELTQVINASSRRIDAYYNRGKCYMHMQQPRFDLALADFNRAIALDPHDGDLYRLRATAYEHLGNHDLALADLKMADKYTWHDPK